LTLFLKQPWALVLELSNVGWGRGDVRAYILCIYSLCICSYYDVGGKEGGREAPTVAAVAVL